MAAFPGGHLIGYFKSARDRASASGGSRLWIPAFCVLAFLALTWLHFARTMPDKERVRKARAQLALVQRGAGARRHGRPVSSITATEIEQYIRVRARLAPFLAEIERVRDARCERRARSAEGNLFVFMATGGLARMAAQEVEETETLVRAFESVARILDEEDVSDVEIGKGAVVIDWRFLHRAELLQLSLKTSQEPALYNLSARCRHAADEEACDRLGKIIARAEHHPSADGALLEQYREQLEALPPEGLGLLTSIRDPRLLDSWCPPPEALRRLPTPR